MAVQRRRLSIWANPTFVTETTIKDAQGIIDDLAMLRTWVNPPLPTSADVWGDPPLPIIDDPKVAAIDFKPIVKACHDHRIQVLAGFAMTGNAAEENPAIQDNFNRWIRSLANGALAAKRSAEIRRVAKVLAGLVVAGGFDGIHFDIEGLNMFRFTGEPRPLNKDAPGAFGNPKDDEVTLITPVVTEFYLTVADELMFAGPQEKLICSVTGAGMVDDVHFIGNHRANFFSRVTRYDLAKNTAILFRPMCFDSGVTAAELPKWHRDIMDHALNSGALTTQFQLGIKDFAGSSKSLGEIMAPQAVRERCADIRARDFGLAVFAFHQEVANTSADRAAYWNNYATYNYALSSSNSVSKDFPVNAQVNKLTGKFDNEAALKKSDPDFDPKKTTANTTRAGTLSAPHQEPLDDPRVIFATPFDKSQPPIAKP